MRVIVLALLFAACAPSPLLAERTDAPQSADAAAAVDAPMDVPQAPDTSRPLCIPGAQVQCACGSDVRGYQVCADDGARMGPCVCPDAGAPVADAGTPVDVAAVDAPSAADAADVQTVADVRDVPAADVGACGGIADMILCPDPGCIPTLHNCPPPSCLGVGYDVRNCGACAHVCPGTSPTCTMGVCGTR